MTPHNKGFIRNWFYLTRSSPKDIRDYYKNFIFSWVGLIFLAKANRQEGNEKDLINKLTDFYDISIKDFVKLERENINKLNILRVRNDTRNGDMTATDRLNSAINSNNSDEILSSLLDVLYVVRCNLFHGYKVWNRDRDDKIIRIASKLIKSYSKMVLKEIK